MSEIRSTCHIFDLDGVLWKSNRLHALVIDEICGRHSLSPLPYEEMAGKPTIDVFKLILSENSIEDDKGLSLKLTKEKQTEFQKLAQEGQIQIVDVEVLKEIIGNSFAALVSGASSNTVNLYLKLLGSNPFSKVLDGSSFKAKPSPDGFLKIATFLNRAPRDCRVYEDSENGLRAARAGGFEYFHIYGDWSDACPLRHMPDSNLLRCVRELEMLVE
jgi:beta-phosphoglucomutase